MLNYWDQPQEVFREFWCYWRKKRKEKVHRDIVIVIIQAFK